MGIPATFIRFAKCNLKCSWCDTKNSWNDGIEYDLNEILELVHYPHVILTGGEPTIYPLDSLIEKIHGLFINAEKTKVSIETNGTNPVSDIIDWVVCSPKPAANYVIRCKPDELKYVVDENFSVEDIPNEYLGKIPIWLQPNAQDLENSLKKCYTLTMNNKNLRAGIQLHKYYKIQ